MKTEAHFSPDRRYRYWLTRVWNQALPMMCVVGVNPSTADEHKDDPTIRKCIGFASRLEFGGLLMLNVGAYRATDPREWKNADDPIGPENSIRMLIEYVVKFQPARIVVAWGNNGTTAQPVHCEAIVRAFHPVFCWGKNYINQSPRHPLLLPYSTPLEPYPVPLLRPYAATASPCHGGKTT